MQSYVVYYLVPLHQSQSNSANQALTLQEKRTSEFLKTKPDTQVLKTFVEACDNVRYRHRWPELEAAITFCLENKANLLIPEIKNLTHNESFSKHVLQLVQANLEIHCCDQPFINKDNFSALAEHAKQQRMLHGQLIRAGLSRTTAKSGNPHALDVITKVNKPKIENAIVFALLLQPVVAEYRHRGLSQRKMVSALNDEGFTAPEGGHWVLSQFQKVLDRIKCNEVAIQLEKTLKEYHEKNVSEVDIAKALNDGHTPCPFSQFWTLEAVSKVEERIQKIKEIVHFYELAAELLPIIEKYHVDELTERTFHQELKQAGIIQPWGHA